MCECALIIVSRNKTGDKDEDDKPGPSSTPHPEKTPAKETDFYDLPDGLSDNEEQAQGQVQRSGQSKGIFYFMVTA